MANNAYLHSDKSISVDMLYNICLDINSIHFDNAFEVINNGDGVFFTYSEDYYLSIYVEEESVFCNEVALKNIMNNVLCTPHKYPFQFMWWVNDVVLHELKIIFGGELYDEGIEGEYKVSLISFPEYRDKYLSPFIHKESYKYIPEEIRTKLKFYE